MNEGEKNTKVSLSGKSAILDGKLIVDYKVKNDLAHSIYIFDEMISYDGDGRPVLDRKTAYCFWDEPRTIRLVRATLKMPLEKEVYSLEIPYARELKSQSELSGRIELDATVPEKSPFYGPPIKDKSRVIDCDRIKLIIGWTESIEGISVIAVAVGGDKALRIRGKWKPHLLSEEFVTPAKVIAHTDTFDRQMPQN